MGARRLRVRSRRSRDSPVPNQCNQTECFDPLVRNCVSCELFHTPDTGHSKQGHGRLPRGLKLTSTACSSADPGASGPHVPHLVSLFPSPSPPSPPPPSLYPPHPFIPSSALPTASSLEPGTALQPQEGSGLRPDVALLFGAPALLGLVLALTLVGLVSLVSWRWRQQLRMTSPDTSEGVQQGENCLCLGRREAQRRLGVGVGVQSFGD